MTKTDWLQTLIPVAALGVLAYLAYRFLQPSGIINFDGQAAGNYGSSDFSGHPTTNRWAPGNNPNLSRGGAPTTPGYFNRGPGTPVSLGSGIGNLFVTTGPGTPNDFFPLGNVITTSRDLTNAEQNRVIQNLPSGIGGWWEPQTMQQPTGPFGSNQYRNVPIYHDGPVVYSPYVPGASPSNPIPSIGYANPIGPVRNSAEKPWGEM